MNALILDQPGHLRAATIDAPPRDLPPGMARVRVGRVGVCGTDFHAWRGRQPFFTYPRILGHELGVVVEEVGAGVTHVRAGDRCAVEPYLSCGTCDACRRGRGNCCERLQVLGVHVDGGMCEELILPARRLHPSAMLDLDQLALVETLGIGAHAVRRAGIAAGEPVLVIGAGPIGLSAAAFARLAGARVVMMDVAAHRLQFARDWLGVPTIDGADANRRAAADLAPGVAGTDSARGAGADGARGAGASAPADLDRLVRDAFDGTLPVVVMDATGNAASMQRAFTLAGHGGRLVFVGLVQADITFHDPELHRRELTLLASRNAQAEDIARVIEAVESGRVDVRPWITHRAPLVETPAHFPAWTEPATGVVKAIIELG